jgi:hypothetical protein
MADEASDTVSGAVKNYLGALGFILPLVGVEEVLRWALTGSGWPTVGTILIVSGLPLYLSPSIWRWIRRPRTASKQQKLEYLRSRDSELGSAIQDMARGSAWGRWYAAQLLVNSGKPAQHEHMIQIASSIVTDKIVDGELEVRGRLPGEMDYNPIPRTYWRSSALTFIADPVCLWRLVIIPRGGAEIEPDGNVIARNPQAAARTARITNYDSLLVDGYQFEALWPKKEPATDKARRRFIWRARWRRLDKDEIRRLSGERNATAIGLLLLASVGLIGLWYIFSLSKTPPIINIASDIKLFAQCDAVGPQILFPSDGRMYGVTLNAFPAPYGIGFGTQTGPPLSVLNFSTPDDPIPTIYKCEFINYNVDPLFNISVALHITFFETLADDPSRSSVHSGAITLDRDGIIEIPKIDAGRDTPFSLYITNGTPQLVTVTLPTNVSLSNGKLVSLTQPYWMRAPWGMHFSPRRIASKAKPS